MGVYNGLGISFPVRITKSEREKAEKRVREVLANWRPPLSVNQAELDVKLRNYSPTGPAITVFLYPPPVEKSASEPEPPSTPVRARDVVHGKRHASETDDDPPIPPTPEASSQRPIAGSTRVASKIRLEVRNVYQVRVQHSHIRMSRSHEWFQMRPRPPPPTPQSTCLVSSQGLLLRSVKDPTPPHLLP